MKDYLLMDTELILRKQFNAIKNSKIARKLPLADAITRINAVSLASCRLARSLFHNLTVLRKKLPLRGRKPRKRTL